MYLFILIDVIFTNCDYYHFYARYGTKTALIGTKKNAADQLWAYKFVVQLNCIRAVN